MVDPCTYLTAVAIVNSIAGSVATGIAGNAGWAAVSAVYGKVDEWRHGQGQPVNHHLQRALRVSLLSATKHLVESSRPKTFLDADQLEWFDRALRWISAEEARLKDPKWEPPEPPGGWQASLVLDPTIEQAEGDVRALRNTLARMLMGEWAEEGLTPAPEAITKALYEGWDWFNQIGLYFANLLKTRPEVSTIFAAGTLAKLDIKTDLILALLAGRSLAVNDAAFHAPSKPSYFVGRKSILETLRTELAEPGAIVPLVGMPGLGKTSLAIEFAHAHRADFDGVYWIDCSGLPLEAAATELASQLNIKPEGDPAAQLREIRRQCAMGHNLLVLDNVESSDFRDLIPGGHCAVLLTTRHRDLPFLTQYRAPDLRVFTPEESLRMFREYLGSQAIEKHEKDYRELADALGGLPLGIAVAASLLLNDSRYTLDRLLLLLKEQSLHKLSDGELDISCLLGAAIASLGEQSRTLLAAMAVCAPSGFRLGLAAEIANLDETAALDGLHDIRSRSLVEEIDKDNRRYRLHALIRSVAGQDPALERRHAEAVARRFKRWAENWRECEQDIADWRVALAWSSQTDVAQRRELLKLLAFDGFLFGCRRGLLVDALKATEAAASVFERLGDRANLAASYGNQGVIFKKWGRLAEAMELYKRVGKTCEELGDRAGLQRSYGNQALILQDWGQLAESMELHKREEKICEELGDRAGLQASYGNQALILRAWGQLPEAMKLLKRQEKICEELGDRAGLQASYGNQALILQDWGRLAEAMELHKREEKICEKLGDRAGLQASYGNQALILKAWGQLPEAMELLKRQEKICEELGDRASLSRSCGNQAAILHAWGRLKEAMELLKRQKKICEDLGDRASLQANYNSQALILRARGELEEAMELVECQLAICHNIGLRSGIRSGFLIQADLFEAMGQPEKAPPLRAEAAAIEAELMRGRGATA
ncbi:MAG: NB-ARC domain-containing protein [Bryobacteraceae bacterium]